MTYVLNSLEIYESADGSTIINALQQIVGAIATAIAFSHRVHNEIIFTIVLAMIGLLIALSINNKNKLWH